MISLVSLRKGRSGWKLGYNRTYAKKFAIVNTALYCVDIEEEDLDRKLKEKAITLQER